MRSRKITVPRHHPRSAQLWDHVVACLFQAIHAKPPMIKSGMVRKSNTAPVVEKQAPRAFVATNNWPP